MKIKLINILLMLLALSGFAQTPESELSDSLVENKQVVLNKYIPIVNGDLKYSAYQIPVDIFVRKINDFKAVMNAQIDSEKRQSLKNLKREDVEFYTYNILRNYRVNYGRDSLRNEKYLNYYKDSLNTPGGNERFKSLCRLIFSKVMTFDEGKRLDSLLSKSTDHNQGALFKMSASYRKWLSDYLHGVQLKKCLTGKNVGDYSNLGMLKVISAEISDPFIREYQLYIYTRHVIMDAKNSKAIDSAYNDFMGVATKLMYKADIQNIYSNYIDMISHTLAPEFSYTDGRQVSLKLRQELDQLLK
ncbi:hypothetical protein [Pedobacter cryoconitis]|uniref:DUF3829 domain-containing protein n=1 Tax=Pedobacter cryoconitis TaxID=188932 RepID=A0A7X0J883_9SPHI|nr:hypothetical protein [Pedobacter cryoconitis]MBB6502896.1 hypothetical protein [Pedobacter cryoconitis]